MTQYRLCPSSEVGYWVLERWVEPHRGWTCIHPGYWSYILCVSTDEAEALKEHLAQPVQYFSGSP